MSQNSTTGSRRAPFPTTRWDLLSDIKRKTGDKSVFALNRLMELYWKPVYCFVRKHGYPREKAQDIVQEFFLKCFYKKNFEKAEKDQGRFRTFLCKCIENFMKNDFRHESAKKRRPPAGLISIHQLLNDDAMPIEPKEEDTPRDIFNRAWAKQIIYRVIRSLERICKKDKQTLHYNIFIEYKINPIFDNAKALSFQELGEKYRISAKEVSNRIITVQRKYIRLLFNEVRLHTLSDEEAAEEIRDILQFISD